MLEACVSTLAQPSTGWSPFTCTAASQPGERRRPSLISTCSSSPRRHRQRRHRCVRGEPHNPVQRSGPRRRHRSRDRRRAVRRQRRCARESVLHQALLRPATWRRRPGPAPACRPSATLAWAFNHNTGDAIDRARQQLDLATTGDDVQAVCRAAARKVLLAAASLTSVVTLSWTTDRARAAAFIADAHPEWAHDATVGLAWSRTPTDDSTAVRRFLDGFADLGGPAASDHEWPPLTGGHLASPTRARGVRHPPTTRCRSTLCRASCRTSFGVAVRCAWSGDARSGCSDVLAGRANRAG